MIATLVLLAMAVTQRLPGADGSPLEIKDIGLMLRGGYTSQETLREVESRHVVDPLDATSEKALRDAGADQRLIDALKSGRYTLPPDESAEAKRRQQEAQERLQSDREAGQDRLLEHAKEEAQAAVSRRMSNQLRSKLVVWKDGQLQAYDENVLSTKKVFAFYFGASWCPSCSQFTPWLIDFYKKFVALHPDFEVVYVSDDRSAEEMAEYMKTAGMPFPALNYDKEAQEVNLLHYAGPDIPSMALVDGAGTLHSYSYDGQTYLGPRHVIADLAKMAGIKLDGDLKDGAPSRANAPPPVSDTRNLTLSGQPE
jgi:nucleoredoxin